MKKRKFGLVFMLLAVIIQIALCVYAGSISLVAMFVLSATIGAYIQFSFFNYAHEIVHNVFNGINNVYTKSLLIKLCLITYFGANNYMYFRWGHIPHHNSLGEHTFEDIDIFDRKKYKEFPDMDLRSVRQYYAMKLTHASEPTYQFDTLFKNRYTRPFIVAFIPLYELLKQLIFDPFLIIYMRIKILYAQLFNKKSVLNHPQIIHRFNSLLMHTTLWVAAASLIWIFLGFQSLLYLFLCQLFVRGFLLHPYLTFWGTVHASNRSASNACQPTHSVYGGKITDFIFQGANYHVEHHDFPNIPTKKLHKLRKIAPEFYDNIHKFNGMFKFYKDFFTSKEKWVYACQ